MTASLWAFPKRLENEKLKEENDVIKGQIENLKALQNDYNDKLDQAAENIEIAKLNLGPSREEFIALEGEVKRIRNSYEYLTSWSCERYSEPYSFPSRRVTYTEIKLIKNVKLMQN